MPLLRLETAVAMNAKQRATLMADLSRIVAEVIGKPEEYVMVTVSHATVMMSGKCGDAAFVDIRGIGGLENHVNRKLSQRVCTLLQKSLDVPPNRTYLNFTDVEAGNWGWNGETFG